MAQKEVHLVKVHELDLLQPQVMGWKKVTLTIETTMSKALAGQAGNQTTEVWNVSCYNALFRLIDQQTRRDLLSIGCADDISSFDYPKLRENLLKLDKRNEIAMAGKVNMSVPKITTKLMSVDTHQGSKAMEKKIQSAQST